MHDYEFIGLFHASMDLETTLLEHDSSVMFTLDEELRLYSCNLAWNHFAAANGGSHLERSAVKGRPLLDFVSGDLRDFYRLAYLAVQASTTAWRHEYECSSADTTRRFSMTVYAIGGGLLVINSLHVEEPHTGLAANPSEANYRTSSGLIVMCSNCRRTRRPGSEETWDWVPAFVSSPRSQVSHGLCPPCSAHYRAAWSEGLPWGV